MRLPAPSLPALLPAIDLSTVETSGSSHRWHTEGRVVSVGSAETGTTSRHDIVERLRSPDVVWKPLNQAELLLLTADAAAELERLQRWKAEAMTVLGEWEAVWEALGRPGGLGSSKAASVRDLIAAGLLCTPLERNIIDAAQAETAAENAYNNGYSLQCVQRLIDARTERRTAVTKHQATK